MNVTFETLSIDHYDDLLTIWKKAKLSHKPNGRDSRDKIDEQMRFAKNKFIGAKVENQYVGAIIASHNGRKGWINRLAVIPEFQQCNIANELIKQAENFLLSQGILIFSCLIEDSNHRSINLFKKNQYAEHRDIIYFSKRLDKNV